VDPAGGRDAGLGQVVVGGRRTLAFLVICIVLAVSATYGSIEWRAALALLARLDDRQMERVRSA